MTKREQLIQWLGDAHAMEVGIVSTLEKHIADAKGKPKIRAGLSKHLQETKRHAKEMKQALASLGGSHPVLKEGVSKIVNLLAGLVTTAAADTLVKNAIADFATEHFEIACYKSLIATAEELGEKKIAATCRGILKEEQAMAKQLDALLPAITADYLSGLHSDPVAVAVSTSAKPARVRANAVRSNSKGRKKALASRRAVAS